MFEEDGVLAATANPWAKQFVSDLEVLENTDLGYVPRYVGRRPLLVFQEPVREWFAGADMG
eukprot:12413521-Alexandrium_andersonii.AAC.1